MSGPWIRLQASTVREGGVDGLLPWPQLEELGGLEGNVHEYRVES